MVADSAISMPDGRGGLTTVDKVEWRKLIWSARVAAGISYWGSIGDVIARNERFDEWIEWRIANGEYHDLPSLADYLVTELNRAAGGRPTPRPMGLHVAGFHAWADGTRRPVFYHIHNGHGGAIRWQETRDAAGRLTAATPIQEWDPRGLFARNDDLPGRHEPVPEAVARLNRGWITRNGDFATYLVISGGLEGICGRLRLLPGVQVPREPTTLGARVAFLTLILETVIRIHKMSSLSKGIGGAVSTLSIGPDGRYVGAGC